MVRSMLAKKVSFLFKIDKSNEIIDIQIVFKISTTTNTVYTLYTVHTDTHKAKVMWSSSSFHTMIACQWNVDHCNNNTEPAELYPV